MSDSQCTEARIGELLHAYELGLLDDEEKQQFEIHLLGCEYCLAQIEKLHQHVTELRSDRVVQEAVAAQCSEFDATEHWWSRVWSLIWSRATLRFRPIYAAAVASILVIAGYIITDFPPKRDIVMVQSVTLVPNRSVSDESFVQSLERDGLLSIVVEDIQHGQWFDVVVLDSRGKVLSRTSSCNNGDSFIVCRLLFPSALMKPGSYSVQVIPRSNGLTADTIRYNFRVVDRN